MDPYTGSFHKWFLRLHHQGGSVSVKLGYVESMKINILKLPQKIMMINQAWKNAAILEPVGLGIPGANLAALNWAYSRPRSKLLLFDLTFESYLLMLTHFSCVQLSVTPSTVARQAPLSLWFSRQEYWSGLPCSLQGIFPTQGLNLCLMSSAEAGRFFTSPKSSLEYI